MSQYGLNKKCTVLYTNIIYMAVLRYKVNKQCWGAWILLKCSACNKSMLRITDWSDLLVCNQFDLINIFIVTTSERVVYFLIYFAHWYNLLSMWCKFLIVLKYYMSPITVLDTSHNSEYRRRISVGFILRITKIWQANGNSCGDKWNKSRHYLWKRFRDNCR